MKCVPEVQALLAEYRTSVVKLQVRWQGKGAPLNRKMLNGFSIIITCRGIDASTKISTVVACAITDVQSKVSMDDSS
jgi:hypothetical protein